MTTHLLPDEMLAEYASGTTTQAVSVLAAAHLTQSPEARERVRVFEDACGSMLEDTTPEAVSDGCFDDILSMIDGDAVTTDAPVATATDKCPLPQPVIDAIGMPFDQIPWKFRLPGVSVHDIETQDGETVSLLRARPGASVPQHTHKGIELTLVMQGVMLDDGIEYHAGDVAVNSEDDDHRPRILGDETCYCLIVQQGDLHFTGRFSRILNYIGE